MGAGFQKKRTRGHDHLQLHKQLCASWCGCTLSALFAVIVNVHDLDGLSRSLPYVGAVGFPMGIPPQKAGQNRGPSRRAMCPLRRKPCRPATWAFRCLSTPSLMVSDKSRLAPSLCYDTHRSLRLRSVDARCLACYFSGIQLLVRGHTDVNTGLTVPSSSALI